MSDDALPVALEGEFQCPECGLWSWHVVDGEEMTVHQINRLPHAPRKIEWKMAHRLTCSRFRELAR